MKKDKGSKAFFGENKDRSNHIKEARNKTLEGWGPQTVLWSPKDTQEFSPGSTLHELQLFIDSSYEFQFNPLNYLQKYFPNIVFEYHNFVGLSEEESTKILSDLIQKKDVLYPAGGYTEVIVSLRRRNNSTPRKICWSPEWNPNNHTSVLPFIWGESVVKAVGGKVCVFYPTNRLGYRILWQDEAMSGPKFKVHESAMLVSYPQELGADVPEV